MKYAASQEGEEMYSKYKNENLPLHVLISRICEQGQI